MMGLNSSAPGGKLEGLFFRGFFFFVPFCFSAGKKERKKERSDAYMERKQDPYKRQKECWVAKPPALEGA